MTKDAAALKVRLVFEFNFSAKIGGWVLLLAACAAAGITAAFAWPHHSQPAVRQTTACTSTGGFGSAYNGC